MSRSRYLKPTFFTNDRIGDLAPMERLVWMGLWCQADREGRLKDRPKRLKIEIAPWDDIDMDATLQCLHDAGFIQRYEVAGERLIWLPSFAEHQHPHTREPASELPAPGQIQPVPGLGNASPRKQPEPAPQAAGTGPASSFDGIGISTESESESARAAAADEDDEPSPIREAISAWTNATGQTVTAQVGDAMEAWIEKVGLPWVLDAIRETGAAGVRQWKYTNAILERWQREGRDMPKPKAEPPRIAPQSRLGVGPRDDDFDNRINRRDPAALAEVTANRAKSDAELAAAIAASRVAK